MAAMQAPQPALPVPTFETVDRMNVKGDAREGGVTGEKTRVSAGYLGLPTESSVGRTLARDTRLDSLAANNDCIWIREPRRKS